MDWAFDTDPSGDLRHYTLMSLRTIVECYYPAIFPTVGSQDAPGPHDPVGPTLLCEIYNYLTQSLSPMVEASIQAPDSPVEVVPANSKSQDWQRRWIAMRQIQTSVSGVIPDTVWGACPCVAGALLIPTLMMILVEQGCHHSVRGGRSLFSRGGIWTCPLTSAGGNWWCDHQLELTPSLPLGRMKIWIPFYVSSGGTLVILRIATFVSLQGTDGLLPICPISSFNFLI